MKRPINFSLGAIMATMAMAILAISCSKKNPSPSKTLAPGLIGIWNIVNDSAYAGVSYNNHPVTYPRLEPWVRL